MRLRPAGKNLKMEAGSGGPQFLMKSYPVLEEELSYLEVLFKWNSSAFLLKFKSENFRIFSSDLLESQDPVNHQKNRKSAENLENLIPLTR